MRAEAAQPCQIRKEVTVSGGLLRRDHPGKGILGCNSIKREIVAQQESKRKQPKGGNSYIHQAYTEMYA